jgi:hypothetical protein
MTKKESQDVELLNTVAEYIGFPEYPSTAHPNLIKLARD